MFFKGFLLEDFFSEACFLFSEVFFFEIFSEFFPFFECVEGFCF